ncbi:hypothetical protein DdX_18563 [Ditylenchus destructor]|uniref:Uncharacterized protein n=1 Tax=Ditylenchus destructor TaxID=166010 RepID=A0AAD4MJZ8_9BILA|nr:hypothetical protein DdX_18563 [Ditylenchus destructor]
MPYRKKVEIPDTAWLDALKFITGPQWMKIRFVSRQLAKVVHGNVSGLPSIVIDNVNFSEIHTPLKPSEMVASGVTIPPNGKTEWFMKRGINFDASTGLQHRDAVIGIGAVLGNRNKPSIYYYADMNELSKTSMITRRKPKTVWRKIDRVSGQECQENRKPQNSIFSAEFNPNRNIYSWPSMEYFLNLLYNPRTYIKEVEMYPLNENLTNAYHIGDAYGSYVHCGKFTVKGDFCKSLPWLELNIRADTIYFPGDLTNIENYNIIDFLFYSSWKCALSQIKFEWVCDWKLFVNILIQEFRTLATIKHATPSIQFSFYKYIGEKPDLNFLSWNSEVVKQKPEDSQSAEAAYVVSSGTNRMDVAIFKRYVESGTIETLRVSDGVKAKTIYDVSIRAYSNQPAAPSRGKVHVLDDAWLEALKFLKFSNWAKALFVSGQLACAIQRNLSCLPRIIVENATMSKMTSHSGDDVVFKSFPSITDVPASVKREKPVIGISSDNCIGMRLRSVKQFKKPVNFCAPFDKCEERSWVYLKYLLEWLYYPAAYIENVEMFALNQKITDILFYGEVRGSFTWKGDTDLDRFRKSLSWLERNVRANTIHFPEHIDYKNENIYEPIANFLMDASWKCARQEVNFKCLCNLGLFLQALIKKFQTISFVRKDVPMFTTSTYGNDETMSRLLLGHDVMKLESDDSESADVYIITNGDNRMQIEITDRQKHGIHGYQDVTNDHRKYHENWRNHGLHMFDVYIKVNSL